MLSDASKLGDGKNQMRSFKLGLTFRKKGREDQEQSLENIQGESNHNSWELGVNNFTLNWEGVADAVK